MSQTYTVPYGKTALRFSLPAGMRGAVAEPRGVPPVGDLDAAIVSALAEPVASPRLRDMARPGQRVCIVVTDVTRACPDDRLLPALLDELAWGGVRPGDVTVVVGLGLHRPSTGPERLEMLGRRVVERCRVVDPDPLDPAQVVSLGVVGDGVPATINRAVLDCDLLVATGIVEPHQYAGYSGGRKTVAIGAAGEETIAYTHGPRMLDHAGTRLGNLDGNPFHEAITEVARRVGLRFILNVVANERKEVVAVRAGEPSAAFLSLVAVARDLFTVSIPHAYDVAVAGVGFPKDANLYQASRAASYLYFAPTPVVVSGGVIIVPARCQEGAGEGIGERRFYEAMRNAPDVASLLHDAREHGYRPGEQRAFIMARVLEHCEVVIVGAECPDVVRDAKMIPVSTMEEALHHAQCRMGAPASVLVVPNALLTLPVVEKRA